MQLVAVAELQHGVAATRQARSLGLTWEGTRSRLRPTAWELATPRVLRRVGVPRTAFQVLMIGVLDGGPDTAVSHAAAAALWGLPGFPFGPVELSRLRGANGSRTHFGRLHERRLLSPSFVTELRGIPVTTLPVTLFHLAAIIPPQRLNRLVNTVAGRSPRVLAVLHELAPEFLKRGRTGSAAMREVLASCPPGSVRPQSGLEWRFMRILEEAGEEPMVLQRDLGGHSWIGRTDFLDPPILLIVELDSDTYHSSPLDVALDERRDDDFLEAGYRGVLRIPEELVWYDPAEALRRLRVARTYLRSGSGIPPELAGFRCQNGSGVRRPEAS